MRLILHLSYSGDAFCGWQIQPNAPSVQQALQQALLTLTDCRTDVVGCGRTDTGVNATDFKAHFNLPDIPERFRREDGSLDEKEFTFKLNAILPPQVVIHGVKVDEDGNFHARFDARARTYRYYLHLKKDPFVAKYSCLCWYELDVPRMNRACAFLLGRHDFRCFEKTGTDTRTNLCTVTRAGWSYYRPVHLADSGRDKDRYLVFTVTADRFLRNMVRALVGTLIDIGRGRREPEYMASLVLPEDYTPAPGERTPSRSDAGMSVPGHALFLSEVEY